MAVCRGSPPQLLKSVPGKSIEEDQGLPYGHAFCTTKGSSPKFYVTVRATVTVWVRLPLVAVIVMV